MATAGGHGGESLSTSHCVQTRVGDEWVMIFNVVYRPYRGGDGKIIIAVSQLKNLFNFSEPVTMKSVALTYVSFEDASKLTRRFAYYSMLS